MELGTSGIELMCKLTRNHGSGFAENTHVPFADQQNLPNLKLWSYTSITHSFVIHSSGAYPVSLRVDSEDGDLGWKHGTHIEHMNKGAALDCWYRWGDTAFRSLASNNLWHLTWERGSNIPRNPNINWQSVWSMNWGSETPPNYVFWCLRHPRHMLSGNPCHSCSWDVGSLPCEQPAKPCLPKPPGKACCKAHLWCVSPFAY